MLSREDKRQYRSELFRHLDGIAVAPTAYALHKKGVLNAILQHPTLTLSQLSEQFSANEGYLNVALRILAAQGWLTYEVDNANDQISVSQNEKSSIAFARTGVYQDIVELIQFSGQFHPRKFEIEPFRKLEKIMAKYQKGTLFESTDDKLTADIQIQMQRHIEGIMVGPTTVHLGMGGMFHKYFMEASFRPDEYHKDPESFSKLLDFLTFLQWFEKNGETYRFTDKGLFFAKRASAYGVTVSYIPTFRNLDELIFGNPRHLKTESVNEPERHVDREMNVWGSGGAHSAYFKKIDRVIIDLFNRPIDEQPRGILDMGCGNGAFLIHLFDVIAQRTKRGEMLEEYPLFLVGVDYNQAALKVTRTNLINADIWAKVIWGDISDPDLLAADLREKYNIDLRDLLNVRTFLDHNRIWADPKGNFALAESSSSGAFASTGRRLPNAAVERNLHEHFAAWKPYVEQHGLLMIELHTIPPGLTAQNLGRTAATAYDATHGYSDQYIVELPVFQKVLNQVGLFNDPEHFARFPDSDLATVSVNFLKGNET